MLMRSAPLEYKYKQDNIPGAIARVISDSEGQNERGRMYYRQILSKVEQLLHHSLSDRQLTKNLLCCMINYVVGGTHLTTRHLAC